MSTDQSPIPTVGSPDEQIDLLIRRLARERAARKEAERLLEVKSRELWTANAALGHAFLLLEEQATHDPLTGLANRRGIHPWVNEQRTGTALAILSLDLDRVKSVNDLLGHPAGDAYLQVMASRITGAVRAEDLVVRSGGDELLVLLHAVRSEEAAVRVAMTILAAVREPLDLGGVHLEPSVSIGESMCADPTEIEDALRRADEALYRAKEAGRDCVRVAGSSLRK